MSRTDPSAATGQTPYDTGLCTCMHLATFHVLRNGERRRCSAWGCGCPQFTARPWCGAPRELGGQQPCPIAEPCDERTCRIGAAAGWERYAPDGAS